jgi:8-hydroxy-5-deazaflavin:NADPH oxidoreductase
MKANSTTGISRRGFVLSASGALLSVTFGVRPLRAQIAELSSGNALRIGIIGSGQMGGGLGLLWASAGHEVFFSSRNPGQLAPLVERAGGRGRAGLPGEAAEFAQVVLVAVPYGALPQVGRDFGSQMRGKIVIDCGNPREDRDGPMASDAAARGTGVTSAEHLRGTRLVRAFNAISYVMLERDAHREGEKIGVPIAGDDPEAVATTVQLTRDVGFDPVVVGGLARAREFDRGTPVYVRGMTARELRTALLLPLD